MSDLMRAIEITIPGMDGWCSVGKGQWLASWIRDNKPIITVEIGVFAGRSLLPMAWAAELNNRADPGLTSKVFGIDPYEVDSAIEGDQGIANDKWWMEVDLGKIFVSAVNTLKRNNLDGCCAIWPEKSQNAVHAFDDASIGLLHIDGNHSSVASLRDVEMWWPKIRPGGVVVLDDIDWETVRPAQIRLSELGTSIHQAENWEVFQRSI
jgi:predicted O-methyltransferase YrrM